MTYSLVIKTDPRECIKYKSLKMLKDIFFNLKRIVYFCLISILNYQLNNEEKNSSFKLNIVYLFRSTNLEDICLKIIISVLLLISYHLLFSCYTHQYYSFENFFLHTFSIDHFCAVSFLFFTDDLAILLSGS